jgi:hypothetical protein
LQQHACIENVNGGSQWYLKADRVLLCGVPSSSFVKEDCAASNTLSELDSMVISLPKVGVRTHINYRASLAGSSCGIWVLELMHYWARPRKGLHGRKHVQNDKHGARVCELLAVAVSQ